MPAIRHWSFARVVLVSVLWFATNVALAALYIYLQFRKMQSSGSGGIGAVSTGVLPVLLYLFGPPVLLLVVWLFVRVKG